MKTPFLIVIANSEFRQRVKGGFRNAKFKYLTYHLNMNPSSPGLDPSASPAPPPSSLPDSEKISDLGAGNKRLDVVFAALADTTRREILEQLAHGPRTVGELARPFTMSLPAISRHLDVLQQAGFLIRERRGQFRPCSLNAAPFREAERFVARYRRFWSEALDSLHGFLKGMDTKGKHPKSKTSRRRSRNRGPG